MSKKTKIISTIGPASNHPRIISNMIKKGTNVFRLNMAHLKKEQEVKNIIDIVESVLIDFNKDIVDSLGKEGTNAISINTKENNIIDVIPESIELGFVGIPNYINTDILKSNVKKN